LPESFQTTVKLNISRVGMAHPDFFQGGPLPTLPPRAGAHVLQCVYRNSCTACRLVRNLMPYSVNFGLLFPGSKICDSGYLVHFLLERDKMWQR